VTSAADQNANVIFGAVIDEGLADEVRVTVIATGFGPTKRQRRREQREVPSSAPRTTEGFDLPADVLDVPSFLRED
jgi:cell division protein FtsZ